MLKTTLAIVMALALSACATTDKPADYDALYARANGYLAVAQVAVAGYALLPPCSDARQAPCYDPALAAVARQGIEDVRTLLFEAKSVANTVSKGNAADIAQRAVAAALRVLELLRDRGVSV